MNKSAMNPQGTKGIEWCDFSWSPITGCLNNCPYCYARRLANRRLRHVYLANPNVAPGCDPQDPFAPRFWPERLGDPVKLKKPSKIFVCSMGELFGPWVPVEWIQAVMQTIRDCPQHTFQLLTKFPGGYSVEKFGLLPANVWMGVSVENHTSANKRIPDLVCEGLGEPGAFFVSCEPLLGPVDFMHYFSEYDYRPTYEYYRKWQEIHGHVIDDKPIRVTHGIDWVIIGAQTGPNAVKPKPEWITELVDDCEESGVPVFIKDSIRPFVPPGYWRREWPKGA